MQIKGTDAAGGSNKTKTKTKTVNTKKDKDEKRQSREDEYFLLHIEFTAILKS